MRQSGNPRTRLLSLYPDQSWHLRYLPSPTHTCLQGVLSRSVLLTKLKNVYRYLMDVSIVTYLAVCFLVVQQEIEYATNFAVYSIPPAACREKASAPVRTSIYILTSNISHPLFVEMGQAVSKLPKLFMQLFSYVCFFFFQILIKATMRNTMLYRHGLRVLKVALTQSTA